MNNAPQNSTKRDDGITAVGLGGENYRKWKNQQTPYWR